MNNTTTENNTDEYKKKYEKGQFKLRYTLEERRQHYKRIYETYNDKIPIIVEYSSDFSNELRSLLKQKYLIPPEYTIGQFMIIIRKNIKLPQHKAIFILVDNSTMLKNNDTFQDIYDKYKDPNDNFLYILITEESTFG